jgi:hypothetical protein
MKIRFEFPLTTPREEIVENYMAARHPAYPHYDDEQRAKADTDEANAHERVDEMYAWFKAIVKSIEEATT